MCTAFSSFIVFVSWLAFPLFFAWFYVPSLFMDICPYDLQLQSLITSSHFADFPSFINNIFQNPNRSATCNKNKTLKACLAKCSLPLMGVLQFKK